MEHSYHVAQVQAHVAPDVGKQAWAESNELTILHACSVAGPIDAHDGTNPLICCKACCSMLACATH